MSDIKHSRDVFAFGSAASLFALVSGYDRMFRTSIPMQIAGSVDAVDAVE